MARIEDGSDFEEHSMSVIKLLSGSYSGAGGAGLGLLSFDSATGQIAEITRYPGTPDASWIDFDAARSVVYVTDEMAAKVGAFVLSADRSSVTPLGYRDTGAKYPCYLRLSPGRDLVAVANYGDDSVVAFSVDPDGALAADPQVLRGVKPADQGHAHWTQWSPEGDRLYMVDLGHDSVRFYERDGAAGRFKAPQVAYFAEKDAGPRHLAFHPDGKHAYLFSEYAVRLTALTREADGRLTRFAEVASLADGVKDGETGAHIAISPDGRFVYVSNRKHNSISVFALDGAGVPSLIQNIPSGGNWPRFFILLGQHLIVANQLSDDLAVFAVGGDGKLSDTGTRFAIDKPVCLLAI
jgi:6-phosphogluconolactonase